MGLTKRENILLNVLIFVVAFAVTSYVIRWLRETDARQRTTIARCVNYDSVYVHDTHYDQTKRDTTPVRVIPAPQCLEDTTR